jgi:choline dehydrogenase
MDDYDYVIVGAGAAGCVLANRLSADPSVRVLLLEAGPEDSKLEIGIPAAFSKLFKSPLDWAYETVEQAHLAGRRLYWPRGKVLGGSSSLNAMIYSRPTPADHAAWEGLGNPGWGWSAVLPYYRRSERQQHGASELHGGDGPLCVSDLRSPNPLTRVFLDACAASGLPATTDFNGPEPEGVGLFQVTQRRGRRHSAADAYLRPARGRPNLTVLTGAQATRVLFDGHRATGVAYLQRGHVRTVQAEREVLLAGGAINSPQLLLLSGVGPADHLRAQGISPVLDLPGVGQNLQDHLAVVATYACTRPLSLASAERLPNLLAYLLFRRGPLTSNVAEAGGFLKTRPDLPSPDLEIVFGPTYYMAHGAANPPGHGFSIGAVLQHPTSRGWLGLRSADPLAPPLIQPNYLSSARDLEVLVQGTRLARQLARARPFDAVRGAEVWPGPNVPDGDDAALVAFVRGTAETLYHPIGTCTMGTDPLAVVDPGLRVHGLEGLRVVDASVVPIQLTGHTQAPTIMLAERAADLVLGRVSVPFDQPAAIPAERAG